MIYSDLKINSKYKVEITPTDRFLEEKNVIFEGDRLVCIFRSSGEHINSNRCAYHFVAEFKFIQKYIKQDPVLALIKTLKALKVSLACPPSDYVPDETLDYLIIYFSKKWMYVLDKRGLKIERFG